LEVMEEDREEKVTYVVVIVQGEGMQVAILP
jgi:hypothetical protein